MFEDKIDELVRSNYVLICACLAIMGIIIYLCFVGIHSGFTLRWIVEETHLVMILPTLMLFPIVFIIFIRTAFSNPGIVPRKVYGLGKNPQLVNTDAKNIPLDEEKTMTIYYCRSCFIHKPPKTVHCRFCNNCVEEFKIKYI